MEMVLFYSIRIIEMPNDVLGRNLVSLLNLMMGRDYANDQSGPSQLTSLWTLAECVLLSVSVDICSETLDCAFAVLPICEISPCAT